MAQFFMGTFDKVQQEEQIARSYIYEVIQRPVSLTTPLRHPYLSSDYTLTFIRILNSNLHEGEGKKKHKVFLRVPQFSWSFIHVWITSDTNLLNDHYKSDRATVLLKVCHITLLERFDTDKHLYLAYQKF